MLMPDPDPKPTFHGGVDPDPDWYGNNADPHADPTQSLHMSENRAIFLILFFTAMPVNNFFYFSHHWQMCHD